MFEFKEFELLAELYVERCSSEEETAIMDAVRESEGFQQAVALGVSMEELTNAVYAAADRYQKIAFVAGMTAMVRMLMMALCKGGKVV